MWDRDWSDSYMSEDSLIHPHRQLILEAVSQYEPIESVYEVGCGAGVNLKLLTSKYPEAKIYGYDISLDAVKKAIAFVGSRTVRITNDVRIFTADIVLNDATAIYVSGKNIKSFIEMLKSYTQKAIVMCEWHSEEGPFIHDGHWVHNYKELLPGCKAEKIPPEAWPESKNWQEFGHIITYETS